MTLSHFICLECKIGVKKNYGTLKKVLEYKCPECGEKLIWVNTKFRIPKKPDKSWKQIINDIKTGKRFRVIPE